MATVGSLAVVLTASATDFERTMGRAARSVKNTEKEFMRSARRMEDIGRKWTMGVTVPIVAGFTAVTKAAIDWEDAFAGVRKTVAATEEQFSELDQSLRKMTERIPMTHRDLAAIAEIAGQLGIQEENIEDFTETMAMMGTATNMASDEAAIALAQMANVMQTGQQSFDRMGSTVVHLGNNLATMESNIVEFGQRIAGAGKIAGLTEAQVLSIGGAFSSVGVNAEAGGTAVSKVLQSMTEAVATGNKNMQVFAAVAGMSAAEFATAWREDAGEAFTRFVEGLGASGDKAFAVLRTLGLTDQRLMRAFLSVAGAGDLLRRSIDMGTKAWEENVALINEANERYKTAASRLQMIRNRAYNAAISFGGAFAPLLEMAMEKVETLIRGLQRLAEWFERLPGPIRVATGNMLLFLAAIGPATMAFALLNRTIAGGIGLIASAQQFAANAAFAFASWRAGAATLGEALKYLAGGPIKLVIMGIGAAIVAAVLMAGNWDKVKSFAVAAWNAISAAVLFGASLAVRGIGLIISAIGFIVPAVRGAGQALIGLADNLRASAGQALNAAKSAASTANTAAQAAKAQENIAKAGQNAANAQEELAESIEGVGKAVQANIQSFDEVHQIQDSMGSVAPTLDEFTIPEIAVSEIPGIGVGVIGDIATAVEEQITKAAETAVSAWNRLKQAMEPVNRVVQWIKDNWPTIGPIIEGIASIIMVLLIPALVKSGIEAMIAAGKHVAAWVMSGLEAVKQGAIIVGQLVVIIAKWAWAGVEALIHAGKVVLAWAMQGLEAVKQGAIIVGQFVAIIAKWAWAGVQALIHAGKIVLGWAMQGAEAVAQGAVMVGQLVLVITKWAWAGIQAGIHAAQMAAAWFVALGPVGWAIAAIAAVALAVALNWDWVKEKTIEIWEAVSTWLSEKWEWIKQTAGTTWGLVSDAITGSIEGAWTWLEETWNSIANFLDRTWEGIKKGASDIWKGIANTIIGFINKIVGALNSMIKEMNKIHFSIPDWVPVIGGKSWGFNLPTIAEIPMLAEGGIITAPTLAMVGERGPEAVIPLSGSGNFVESIASAVERGSYAGTVQGMRVASASGGQQADQQEVVLRIDSTTLARLILPAIIKEGQRQGLNLVVQGG